MISKKPSHLFQCFVNVWNGERLRSNMISQVEPDVLFVPNHW